MTAGATVAPTRQITVENAHEHLRRLLVEQAEAWGCKLELRSASDGDAGNPLDVYAFVYRDCPRRCKSEPPAQSSSNRR